MPICRATILGGLPVWVEVSFGYDEFAGEHWAEVQKIWWRKRDGSRGKEVTQKVFDRALNYDSYFGNLIEQANEELAQQSWEEKEEERRDASHTTFLF